MWAQTHAHRKTAIWEGGRDLALLLQTKKYQRSQHHPLPLPGEDQAWCLAPSPACSLRRSGEQEFLSCNAGGCQGVSRSRGSTKHVPSFLIPCSCSRMASCKHKEEGSGTRQGVWVLGAEGLARFKILTVPFSSYFTSLRHCCLIDILEIIIIIVPLRRLWELKRIQIVWLTRWWLL